MQATNAPRRTIDDPGTTMANRESAYIEITPEVLLKAYACGIFPMAESAEDPSLYWIEPDLRGIIPLDRFYVSSRLARTVRSDQFKVTVNRDFDGVIDGCAEPQPGRPRTWINERIRSLYRKLHERRHCHSLEVYLDGELVGGLYGVALGRAFFGESMFHRDARRVEGRAGASGRAAARRRLRAARHAVRHRSPQDVRSDRGAAPAISQAAGSGAVGRRRFPGARQARQDRRATCWRSSAANYRTGG